MTVKLIDGKHLTRETVVEQYTGLVHQHANRLSGEDYHLRQDLAQEGYIGLIYAFDRFDTETGYRFMTYALPYVWGFMMRMQYKRGLIRAPENVAKLAWRIEKEVMWDLSDEEISEELGEGVTVVASARRHFQARVVLSFDKGDSSDEEGQDYYNLQSFMEDFSSPIVRDYLKLLTDREGTTLNLLVQGYNQAEISRMLGYSKTLIGMEVRNIRVKLKHLEEAE